MRTEGRRQSSNVEDRRGMSASGKMMAGGGALGIIILLLNMFLGGDTADIASQLNQLQTGASEQKLSPQEEAADNVRADFVKVVLADTEDVWDKIFRQAGTNYPAPTLVLFRDAVQSGCGNASSAMGPFYCPADNKLYIDLSFYEELQTKFKAPGDFAMAYVVAHEVGHHIQNLTGTAAKMQQLRGQVTEEEYNNYSVKMELQADFYAGVWAHHAEKILTPDGRSVIEEGDIEEALNAANAIGDDRLQSDARGYVVPESFTHGTSEQRMRWFRKGYMSGRMEDGNTFSTDRL